MHRSPSVLAMHRSPYVFQEMARAAQAETRAEHGRGRHATEYEVKRVRCEPRIHSGKYKWHTSRRPRNAPRPNP